MDTPDTPHTCSTVTAIFGSIALLLVGAVIGVFADPYLPASLSNTKKASQAGFAEAKALVDNSNLGKSIKVQNTSRNLSGKVTKVGSGTFTVHVTNSLDPFADPALSDRTIILNASTTLSLITEKAPAKKTKAGETTTNMPTFERTPIQASDIRVGDSVGVFLSAETVSAKEPIALAVQVLPRK
jgi:hypothetical protein